MHDIGLTIEQFMKQSAPTIAVNAGHVEYCTHATINHQGLSFPKTVHLLNNAQSK